MHFFKGNLVLLWFAVTLFAPLVSGGDNARSLFEQFGHQAHFKENVNYRIYYIAAEEVEWDYAPSGQNVMMGRKFNESEGVFVDGTAPDRIGRVYRKAVYRQYTDQNFTTQIERGPDWKHLGALGPVIRAAVGEGIVVIFKNNTTFPASMHPHGALYDKSFEGVDYNDGSSKDTKKDGKILPGKSFMYVWDVPQRAGPGPNDPSSIVWLYHSHVDEPADTNSGLVGPMVITSAKMADSHAKPTDVDREFVMLYTIYDENESHYLEQNIARYADSGKVDREDDDFIESNLMHAINGYLYANLPAVNLKIGESVRWYLLAMGTEVDLHTPHWHGQTVLFNGNRTDVVEMMPASMKTVTMNVADSPGTWMFHCHVNDHIKAGMTALYTISPAK